RQMTPAVLLALIERMSPQELINNLAALQRRGALDNADLKGLVERKLEEAKGADRVSAFKAAEAVKAAPGLAADVRQQLGAVTDEEENAAPCFAESLRKYREELRAEPGVVFVRTPGGRSYLEERCRQAGFAADAFQFTGDYYALPNLVPLLTRPSRLELLTE